MAVEILEPQEWVIFGLATLNMAKEGSLLVRIAAAGSSMLPHGLLHSILL